MAKKQTKTIKAYQSIRSLNLPDFHTYANIHISIKGQLNSSDSYRGGYNITISDCSNQINIHGGITTPVKRNNAIYKMDTMINELSKARDYLIEECKKNNVRIKPNKENTNESKL